MTRALVAPVRRRPSGDSGFTLIEVIVSLSLIAIISTAALYFFISGTRSLTHQQRAHGAVALANDAMESAYSWVPTASTSGTSGLVVGRTQADVTAAWTVAAAAGIAGIADTYPAWDTATTPAPATGPADDVVALTSTATESRAQYTITTLIGTCYRQTAVVAGPCTQTGGDATGVAATGYARLMRVMVVVSWPNTSGTCTGSSCTYQIASLIDPSSDVKWNNTTRLLAVDAGTSAVVDVLGNDTLMQISSNPVSLVSAPVKAGTSTLMGSATVDTTTGNVTYVAVPTGSAPAAPTGEVTFTYRVTVGARSAQAVVHVYVKPQAKAYAVSTLVGSSVLIPITTVSGAAPTSIDVTETPGAGNVTTTGTSFRYTPAVAGTYSFKYTYTDSEGMTSLPGTVTITVTTYATPLIADVPVNLSSSLSPTSTALDLRSLTGNPTGYKTKVLTVPAGGTGTLAVGATPVSPPLTTTNAVAYTPPAKWAGTTSFTFQMLTPDASSTSATGTVTIRVTPVAVADPSFVVTKKSNGNSLNVRANDLATSGVKVTVVSGPTCGALSTNQGTGPTDGIVFFDAPTSPTTCYFDYKLVTTDASSPALASAVTHVTIRVQS
jgi:prepilin-type N-terminal cleavage/methylation domain-containing protein